MKGDEKYTHANLDLRTARVSLAGHYIVPSSIASDTMRARHV